MRNGRRFGLNVLIASILIVGFGGFIVGFNYLNIEDYVQTRVLKKGKPGLPADLSYQDVEQAYDLLKEHYAGNLDAQKLLEGAKKGLVAAAGDPYTVYLTAKEAQEFKQDLDGQFSGIGAEIAIKNEKLVVVSPLNGSPAEAAGLRPGDHIVRINGEVTVDMSVEEAISKIRGPAGSEVKLDIIRGNDRAKEYKIKRAVIEVPSVNSELKDGNVGYIEIVRFSDDTAAKMVSAAKDLAAKGAKKYVIDLRNNPGGLLQAAVDVADEFLDVGKVIVEERKDDEVLRTFRSTAGGTLVGQPTEVLINEGSASASEIVAGALMENGAATTVGQTTFGKGSVQELVEADGGAYIKITIARWYTPKGNNISENGIKPDVKVSITESDFNNDRDPQLQKAIQELSQ